jgi:hypothetical protein
MPVSRFLQNMIEENRREKKPQKKHAAVIMLLGDGGMVGSREGKQSLFIIKKNFMRKMENFTFY